MNRKQFLFSLVTIPATLEALAGEKINPQVLTGKKTPLLRYGLQHDASKAFEAMKKEAAKKGIKLHITSGHRGYTKQLAIWNAKYDRYTAKGLKGLDLIRKITEFSAIPGTSRHHWGTDADILDVSVPQPSNPLSPTHYVKEKGVYSKLNDWMISNAARFDFYEAYTDDLARTGYEYEPWHYSYKPLSVNYLKAYNQLISLNDFITPELKGKELIDEAFFQKYKRDYVNGINGYLKV